MLTSKLLTFVLIASCCSAYAAEDNTLSTLGEQNAKAFEYQERKRLSGSDFQNENKPVVPVRPPEAPILTSVLIVGESGLASINFSGANNRYREGDRIPPYYVLTSISPLSVELECSGNTSKCKPKTLYITNVRGY